MISASNTEASIAPITRSDLVNVKRAYTTRRVNDEDFSTLLTGAVRPRIGDLVLASVEKIGSHKQLELPTGRKAHLAVGDKIIVAYGNRYAPDQFEAMIGKDLGRCHLVAAGGVAASKISKHDRMSEPTRILPLGLIGSSTGKPINLADYALAIDDSPRSITTILVAGTSMNAGKTTTAASLVHALAKAGQKVAGIKSTGTGSGGDAWLMLDMGAALALDFTDAGLPSTYLASPHVIEHNVLGLIGHAADQGCSVAVVEVADGLHHEETATLLKSSRLRAIARGVVFAANDALGAEAGVAMLRDLGHRVLAVSGQLTRSPLAIREASRATGLPVVTAEEVQAGCLSGLTTLPATGPIKAGTARRPAVALATVPSLSRGHGAAESEAVLYFG